MTLENGNKTFQLRVRFTGLCLLLRSPANPAELRILLPDARHKAGGLKHLDGKNAVDHVGFVQIKRAYLPGTPVGARGEIVRRLSREELRFDMASSTDPITEAITVADFSKFAPDMKLKEGLFGSTPPDELLARLSVTGGALSESAGFDEWKVSQVIGAVENPTLALGRNVTWVRELPGDGVVLSVANFRGDLNEQIPLRAMNDARGTPAIEITLGNRCARNPLDWYELEPEKESSMDLDFKWLTKLYQIPPDVTFSAKNQVPHLIVTKRSKRQGEIQNCNSGRGTF